MRTTTRLCWLIPWVVACGAAGGPAGPRINVKNGHGGVVLVAEDGREDVDVTQSFSGADSPARDHEVRVQKVWQGDTANVWVDFPARDPPDIHVDLEVHSPRGLRFEVLAPRGDIHVSGAHGGGEASTDDGNITGEDLQGPINAEAVRGSVHLEADLGSDTIQARAKHDVELVVPADTHAAIDASAVRGRLRFEGVEFHGLSSENAVTGVVNAKGRGRIRAASTGGDIVVRGR